MYYSKIYIFYGRYLKTLNMIILPLTITRRSVCVKHISRRTLTGLCSIHFCTLFILTCLLLCRVALSLRFKSKLWRQNCFKFFFLSTILQSKTYIFVSTLRCCKFSVIKNVRAHKTDSFLPTQVF